MNSSQENVERVKGIHQEHMSEWTGEQVTLSKGPRSLARKMSLPQMSLRSGLLNGFMSGVRLSTYPKSHTKKVL